MAISLAGMGSHAPPAAPANRRLVRQSSRQTEPPRQQHTSAKERADEYKELSSEMFLLLFCLIIGISRGFAPPLTKNHHISHQRLASSAKDDEHSTNGGMDRRSVVASSIAAASAALLSPSEPVNAMTKDSEWPLWTALPVAPYSKRRTIMKEIANGVYTFDQLIGIYYVHVPIRMTVCAVDGGLFGLCTGRTDKGMPRIDAAID